jgi:lipoyl(octanoyl) transferase
MNMHKIKFIDLGLKDYQEAWDYQQDIQNRIVATKISGEKAETPCLIFVEHPHVFTLGKSGKENNLLVNPQFLVSVGAAFYKTDRGGDITYHGPGQLVGYPVFDLDLLGIGVKKYIYLIEEAIIQTVNEYGIQATRLEGATGVWIVPGAPDRPRKICAIGVKVSRGVTMHGFALNISTDLNFFRYINPCGFTDKEVTSMESELGRNPGMDPVKKVLVQKICDQFSVSAF